MCNKILVVNESGTCWINTPTIEGSLEAAQESIGDYVKHIEDSVRVAKHTPRIYDSYADVLKNIDLTMIKIDMESRNVEGAVPADWLAWLNHIWTLKPEEQRILLKKMGISIKNKAISGEQAN